MLDTFLASLPVVALIGVGYGLRRVGFPGEAFWRPAARFVYFVSLPALLVRLIATAELDGGVWRSQLAIAGAIFTVVGVLLVLRKRITARGPAFTSVLQGSVRHNTYIGLAIGAAVLRPDEVAHFVLVAAAAIPVVNVVSVWGLSRYGRREGTSAPGPRDVARRVLTNPLILSCFAGAVLGLSGSELPAVAGEALRLLGQPALPVGLLAVGAGLQADALRGVGRETVVPAAVRLLLYPLLAVAYASALGIAPADLAPLLLLASLPTAASAYVLALELGGDEALMARVITVETVAATVTVPVVLDLGLS